MITAIKDNAGAAAAALLVVLLLAVAWLSTVAAREAFPQEKYNTAYVWCESQPDVESCRWGAFTALYQK